MNPRRRATQAAGSPPNESAHPRASDPATPAHDALGGLELDSRRVCCASGRSRDVNRREHRRAEQADGEREWEKVLAGEVHAAAVFGSGWSAECWCHQSFVPARETSVKSDEEFSRDARHRSVGRYRAAPLILRPTATTDLPGEGLKTNEREPHMTSVTVLGGAGFQGSQAARLLHARSGVTEVVIGDLNLQAAEQAAKMIGPKCRGLAIDATDGDAIANTLTVIE
jgi:hypothetical protein